MFHGGTNFGFMNGANQELSGYRADVTSYDYACPLDECGDPSPRFSAYRSVLEKYCDLPEAIPPEPGRKHAYGTVEMAETTGLFESLRRLSQPVASVTPPSMEIARPGLWLHLIPHTDQRPTPRGDFPRPAGA